MPQVQTQPYNKTLAVTLSDTVNLDGTTTSTTGQFQTTTNTKPIPCEALFVGTKGATGTMVVVAENGATVTFVGIAAGTIVPFKAIRVNNTTTDVSNVVALYTV